MNTRMTAIALFSLCSVLPIAAHADTRNDPGGRSGAVAADACLQADQIAASFRALAAWQTDARDRNPSENVLADAWAGLGACGQVPALTRAQLRALVGVFYDSHSARLLAAVRDARRDRPVAEMIADVYTRAPERVEDDPALAAVTATALIAVNRSYNVAYQDLAFAAVYKAADPATVRGYLRHFGCLRTDAVWAALTTHTRDFIAGESFPAETRADDWAQADLVNARLQLMQNRAVPRPAGGVSS